MTRVFGLRLLAATIVASVATVACHRSSAKSTTDTATTTGTAAESDTLRGIVAVVGTATQPTVAITGTNGITVVVQGAAETVLRNVNTLEVTLFGAHAGTVAAGALPRESPLFTATTFVVRAVQGVPASDGILLRVESGFALQHVNGTLSALRVVPEALHAHVGARIFWVGPYDTAPSAYGIITSRKP